jgi:Pyruvate/2-oxoacid:ferredoxin oxidoreductase gamma subunit
MMDLTNPILLGPVQNQEHYMNGVVARRNNFAEPILKFLEDAYEKFAELTGRSYGLISKYKTDDAETVFVSLGSAAENIEAAVDYLRQTRNASVGSIHVNVIRPFPEAAIVAALKGKKNVIILERTDEALSGDNPLGRDIRTAFSKAVQSVAGLPAISLAEVPKIYGGSYGLGSRDFRPEHIIGAYEFATANRARKDGKHASDGVSFFVLGIDHPYAVIGDETPSLLPEGAVAVRFHSIGGWGAITTGKNLGAILGDLNDLIYERDGEHDALGNPKEVIHVSANPKYGSEKKGAPTSYFMVAAKDRIRVNCDLRHVTVVLCCDPKAFTHTNPLDGMAEGGSLVWESDQQGEQAWEQLPLWARKQIIDKKIRVFTLPGFEIAKKATDRGDLQLRMQGNAFLGAFFRVSTLLKEFGITQEQYRAVVRKQYVKQVRQAGRGRRRVQHGSHDAGLRSGGRDQNRRAHGGRPFFPARPCADADSGDGRRWWLMRLRLPLPCAARRSGCAHAAGQRRKLRRRVPRELWIQPALHAALGHGHDRRRHRRHGLQIRGPPRNAALHRRELHPVHGLHLRLPGHRPAQHRAGPEHAAADCRLLLRGRGDRPCTTPRHAAGDREASTPAHDGRH